MSLDAQGRPVANVNTKFARTLETRVVESSFTVADDYIRQYRDVSKDFTFQPVAVRVTINVNTGRFSVYLQGPAYGDTPRQGLHIIYGDHYLDVDQIDQFATDAVVACLKAHELY